jgi:penicillin-insensitive murein endopeptidase
VRRWLSPFLCTTIFSFPLFSFAAITSKKDSRALFDQWAKVKTPLAGDPQPIGAYSAGCLLGASTLPVDGANYAVMRLTRSRNFAHPVLINYLQAASDRVSKAGLPLMLIGDVSPPRGGPMLSGHASHQIGLDADIWLTMGSSRPSVSERESWGAPSFVIKRKKLKKTWSSTQASLVSTLADFPEVNRIFVSPPIKRYFCTNFPHASWLYKLRAWWGHEEHVHVRLSCPAGTTLCQSQPALNPNDNGCGQDLAWWFSKEADDEWQKMISHPSERVFPDLPAECAQMLN